MLIDAIDLEVQNVVHIELNGCTQLVALHDQNVLLVELNTAEEDMEYHYLGRNSDWIVLLTGKHNRCHRWAIGRACDARRAASVPDSGKCRRAPHPVGCYCPAANGN